MTLRLETAPAEPLRDAAWISAQVFGGLRTARWVNRNVPGVRPSPRRKFFYESSVRRWLKEQEE